jgi:hypothetical protein
MLVHAFFPNTRHQVEVFTSFSYVFAHLSRLYAGLGLWGVFFSLNEVLNFCELCDKHVLDDLKTPLDHDLRAGRIGHRKSKAVKSLHLLVQQREQHEALELLEKFKGSCSKQDVHVVCESEHFPNLGCLEQHVAQEFAKGEYNCVEGPLELIQIQNGDLQKLEASAHTWNIRAVQQNARNNTDHGDLPAHAEHLPVSLAQDLENQVGHEYFQDRI